MDEYTDRDLARLYYKRYCLLRLDQEVEVDPFEVLDDREVEAMAGALRHVLARLEQART